MATEKITAKMVIKELEKVADKKRAVFVAGYFKTGKGQYGEGDTFIGVPVPSARIIAKKFQQLSLSEVSILLKSNIHEHRLTALLILCYVYKNIGKNIKEKQNQAHKKIFDLYLKHTKCINNWDLVDTSARDIVGHYIWNYYDVSKRKAFLKKLATSKLIWERRIAVISTFYGIGRGELKDVFYVAGLLMKDSHDLIHKAVGWMLREAGKKDVDEEKVFLDSYAPTMPRTMLRYAIERFGREDRGKYMNMGKVRL